MARVFFTSMKLLKICFLKLIYVLINICFNPFLFEFKLTYNCVSFLFVFVVCIFQFVVSQVVSYVLLLKLCDISLT